MPSFRAGEVIAGRYELIRCIGTGAMGAVFRAHDRVLDAELAVKLIRIDRERIDAERATRRLLLEARAIARISHPGIVRVFDFGSSGEVPFIVMELLQGESLLEMMGREGALDAVRAVRTLLPIADALSVAHRRGVVHRDIKPDNVFLHRDEFARVHPKLVDFGVARVHHGSGFTRPGALMGTPDYMAPEQAQAEPDVDHRADVWAYGVLLYELMTLRRPFAEGAHGNYLAVLKAVVGSPPRPIMDYGVGDADLWAILARALEKSRDQRFQDIREMGEQLSRWLLAQGVTEDAYGASLRSSWVSPSDVQGGASELTSATMRCASSAGDLEVGTASQSWDPPQDRRAVAREVDLPSQSGPAAALPSSRPSLVSGVNSLAPLLSSTPAPEALRDSISAAAQAERAQAERSLIAQRTLEALSKPPSARSAAPAKWSSHASFPSNTTDPPPGQRRPNRWQRFRPSAGEIKAVLIAVLLASLLAVISVWFGILQAEPQTGDAAGAGEGSALSQPQPRH